MHLKELELSNFKTIENFKADFQGDVYLIEGDNEVGKSTLLQSIAILLAGSKEDVLKIGSKKGFARAIVGDNGKLYDVDLNFTEKNPKGTLSITDKETGLKTNKVSSFKDIFGYYDFDVNEFAQWGETAEGRRKQIEIFKSLLPDETISKLNFIDSEIEKNYNERKQKNSELKIYESIFNSKSQGIDDVFLKKHAKPKELSECIEKKTKAIKHNEDREGVIQRLEKRKQRKSDIPEALEVIKKRAIDDSKYFEEKQEEAKKIYELTIARIKKEKEETHKKYLEEVSNLEVEDKELTEKIEVAKKWINDFPEIDLTQLQNEIDDLQNHNLKNQKVVEYNKAKEALLKAKYAQEEYECKLNSCREEKEKLIKDSQLPIEGLSFNDEGLILNGIPFQKGKVSTSQEMEVAVKILMAKNKKTKIFRIARGESLGENRLKAIVDFAQNNGYQGFIESVVRGESMSVTKYTEK